MSNDVNYKSKYQQLKLKFMNSVDMAFRLGYEQGQKDSQLQQAAEQQAQQQAQDQAMAQQGGGFGGGEKATMGEQEPGQDPDKMAMGQPEQENPQGTELDQHIAKLEGMLGKSELNSEDLKKTLSEIQDLRKKQKEQASLLHKKQKEQAGLKKSAEAIKGIATALHKPAFKINQQASHNLDSNAKAAVNMQERIINDVMKSWEEEESKAGKGIESILGIEGITIKKD